jgi:hypothetical protein
MREGAPYLHMVLDPASKRYKYFVYIELVHGGDKVLTLIGGTCMLVAKMNPEETSIAAPHSPAKRKYNTL